MQIELKLREFNKEKDLKLINKWYGDWSMSQVPEWFLPEIGYVVEGVCAAFMYKTDSKVAYMENVISNPDAPHELRALAVGMLGDQIFKKAKELGFKVVLGWTKNKSVSSVSGSRNMKISKFEYAVLVKMLGDK